MLASERLGRSDEKVLGKLEKKKARQRENFSLVFTCEICILLVINTY